VPSAGLLDFVAAWYRKAADYMADNPKIKAAFVSTNSITQGEQVGVLWPDLLKRGVKIHFAHRTFQWSSEARGKAAVHCVIIGFALHDTEDKRIFDYETPQAEPHEIKAKNINPLSGGRGGLGNWPPGNTRFVPSLKSGSVTSLLMAAIIYLPRKSETSF
jgi:hypothetical protein